MEKHSHRKMPSSSVVLGSYKEWRSMMTHWRLSYSNYKIKAPCLSWTMFVCVKCFYILHKKKLLVIKHVIYLSFDNILYILSVSFPCRRSAFCPTLRGKAMQMLI